MDELNKSNEVNRRNAVKSVAAAFGSVVGATMLPTIAFAADKPMNESFKGPGEDHTSKPLSFDPKKLRGISEKMITSHWENNYGGSVKTLNSVNKKLQLAMADKDFPPFAYNGLKREHLMRTGSVVLHELYFENLGGDGKAGGEIEKNLKTFFRDFNSWETEFRKIATGLAGGSGWVVLGYNYHLR